MSEFKELKSNPHRDFYNVRKVCGGWCPSHSPGPILGLGDDALGLSRPRVG